MITNLHGIIMNQDENQIADLSTAPVVQQNFTLKLLFGPMFGCELNLLAEDYFLITGYETPRGIEDDVVHEHHAAAFATNTLYIPSSAEAPNITLHLSECLSSRDPDVFSMELHDEKDVTRESVKLNTLISRGIIRFAVKRSEEEWNLPIIDADLPTPEKQKANKNFKKIIATRRFLIAGGGMATLLLLAAVFFGFNLNKETPNLHPLEELVAHTPGTVSLLKSRQGDRIFLLTENFETLEWIKASLSRSPDIKNAVPALINDEEQQALSDLITAGYPALQVNLQHPLQPSLSLYQAVPVRDVMKIKKTVMQSLPFAKSVQVQIKDKKQLLESATQGLDRLHIVYEMHSAPSGYTLAINGDLHDTTLNDIESFIRNFYRQWGDNFIHFSVNPNENLLHDKSYVTSQGGYVFLGPKQWYFTSTLGESKWRLHQ